MPVARVQLADGRIARIEVPAGTTPEQAQRMAEQVAPKGDNRPVSKTQGVLQGLGDVAAGVTDILGGKPGQFSPMGMLSPLYDMGAAYLRSKQQDVDQKSPYQTSKGGRLVGQVAGSIPLGGISNPWLGGAVGGAVLSNKRNPSIRASPMAMSE